MRSAGRSAARAGPGGEVSKARECYGASARSVNENLRQSGDGAHVSIDDGASAFVLRFAPATQRTISDEEGPPAHEP